MSQENKCRYKNCNNKATIELNSPLYEGSYTLSANGVYCEYHYGIVSEVLEQVDIVNDDPCADCW